MLPIAALAIIVSVAAFSAAGNPLAQRRQNTPSAIPGDLEVLQIRPDFYMIAGAGGNIAVQVGSDGVVLAEAGRQAQDVGLERHSWVTNVAIDGPREECNGERASTARE